jgi:hypothetical protein
MAVKSGHYHYGMETACLYLKDRLRRIYGAVESEEGWRIRNNDEMEKLMRED